MIVVVAGGLLYIAKYQSSPNQQQTQPIDQKAQTKTESNTIVIQNFTFNPGVLTVKLGTRITWINQDNTIHSIKSDTFNSTDLNTGDKFEFIFNTKGSFEYGCGIHPSMNGKIVVE